jgi:hypothetical protein
VKTKHNSNHKKQQVTLMGKLTEFFVFAFVGIVPIPEINLTKHQQKGRFVELNREQIMQAYDL